MRHRWTRDDARALQRYMEQQAIREQVARSLGCHPDDIEITDEEEGSTWDAYTWLHLALSITTAAAAITAAWRAGRRV